MNHTLVDFSDDSKCVEPPQYIGNLLAVLPGSTGRYEVAKRATRASTVIPAGYLNVSTLSTATLPSKWTKWIHPEGKVYFSCNCGFRVVTDSYLFDAAIASKVEAWIDEIRLRAKSADLALGSQVELFLQVTNDSDCNYYFANLQTRSLFWLDECSTASLGLLPVVSSSHLGLVLESEFWAHIENFSMHFGGLPQQSIDDLILVFTHGVADTMTSTLSTFPYDTATSEKILNLLISSQDKIHRGEVVALVARFWGLIIYNRYETHFGEEQARLSRDSVILDGGESQELQWTRRLSSKLTLGVFEHFIRKFEGLFVDNVVYGSEWDSFMNHSIQNWRDSIALSFALLMMHVFFLLVPISPISRTLAIASGLTSSLAILVAVLLICRHESMTKGGATPAHEYLSSIKSSRFGFQGIAFAFALPRALSIWSLILVFTQWAVFGYEAVAVYPVALVAPVAVVLVLLIVFASTSPSSYLRIPTFRFWRSTKASDLSMA